MALLRVAHQAATENDGVEVCVLTWGVITVSCWGKRLQNSTDIINPFKTRHVYKRVRSDSIRIREQKQAPLSLLSEVRILVILGGGTTRGQEVVFWGVGDTASRSSAI